MHCSNPAQSSHLVPHGQPVLVGHLIALTQELGIPVAYSAVHTSSSTDEQQYAQPWKWHQGTAQSSSVVALNMICCTQNSYPRCPLTQERATQLSNSATRLTNSSAAPVPSGLGECHISRHLIHHLKVGRLQLERLSLLHGGACGCLCVYVSACVCK